MNNLKDILKNKELRRVPTSTRPINEKWERAKEFGNYVGLSTPIVLRLFRLYGEKEVLNLRSWIYDIPQDPNKGGKIALITWKLKELKSTSVKNDKTYTNVQTDNS